MDKAPEIRANEVVTAFYAENWPADELRLAITCAIRDAEEEMIRQGSKLTVELLHNRIRDPIF